MVNELHTASAVQLLSSLAQEARLAIFRLLVQAGKTGLAAGKISEQLNIPVSTLSFHLKALSHTGLISAKQDGRFVIYSANYATMNDLIAFLTENCCIGEAQTSDCSKVLCKSNQLCK